MCGNSAYCWNTMLTGRRFADVVVTSAPCSTTRPTSGVSKPAIMRSVVVLPQPDGPSIEKNSPSRISSVTSSTAVWLPKRLLTASSAIAAMRRLRPADDVENVALGILEPRGRDPTPAVDLTVALDARDVVVLLESDPLALQAGDRPFEVVDEPRRRRRLV